MTALCWVAVGLLALLAGGFTLVMWVAGSEPEPRPREFPPDSGIPRNPKQIEGKANENRRDPPRLHSNLS